VPIDGRAAEAVQAYREMRREFAMVRKVLMLACALVLGSAGAVSKVHAQTGDLNLPVYFTFSQSVALPRVTLPAWRYLFKLVDSNTTRSVVQVSSADGKRQIGFFSTVPVQRNQPPNDPEVRFLEAPANEPTAIATYWYPGRKLGWEFVYPRAQATRLAQSSKQSVLTTAGATDASADEMRTAPLARVNPTGDQSQVGNEPSDITIAGNSTRGELGSADASATVAQDTSSRTNPAPSTSMASQSTNNAPRTRLPQTSSAMPLVAIIGALLLCAGVVLRVWRRLGV